MTPHILVERTLESLMVASDKKALLFKTDSGDVIAKADGDCCSSTWIESVELPALGFPARVLDVTGLDMPEQAGTEDGCTAFYGCKIATDRGDIVIDYRNESNGYYGGSLCWPDDYFYGGVYGQNISNEEWTALT